MKKTKNVLFAIVALFAVAAVTLEAGSRCKKGRGLEAGSRCQKRRTCCAQRRACSGPPRGQAMTKCRGGRCRMKTQAATQAVATRGECRGGMCSR